MKRKPGPGPGPVLHAIGHEIPGQPKHGGSAHFRSKAPPPGKHAPLKVDKITCTAATHDDRYQVAPGAKPFGAGFVAAGPGIDVTTGKPWMV